MGGRLEQRVGSLLSPEDHASWARISDVLAHSRVSSDLYNGMNLAGKRAAVIGPWYMPQDFVAFQIAHNLGPNGLLYSVDPQGDSSKKRKRVEIIVGGGDSTKYGAQLRLLRNLGFPLAPFEWLGVDSSIAHIPYPAKNLDLIADHGTLEFVGLQASAEYLRHGVEEIVRSLRVGGIWVHHSGTRTFLDCCVYSMRGIESYDSWFSRLGLRVVTKKIPYDAYAIPVSFDTATRFLQSPDIDWVNVEDYKRKLFQKNKLMLGGPAYRKRWIHVAQRLW